MTQNLYPDTLRLENLPPGTLFHTLAPVPVRAVTTRWHDDLAVLCVQIDQYPGQLEPMLGKTPVQVIQMHMQS